MKREQEESRFSDFARTAYFLRTAEQVAATVGDFMFGNPHEPASRRFTEVLAAAADPKGNARYFAYTRTLKELAEWVRGEFLPQEFDLHLTAGYYEEDETKIRGEEEIGSTSKGTEIERDDEEKIMREEGIVVTNGAFSGLLCSLQALVDAGDEVIYLTPCWFFYRSQIVSLGAVPVRVEMRADENFALPIQRIAEALTSKTRVLLLNTPHNPTGRIFSEHELSALSELLEPRGIFVIQDAAYQEVRFCRERPPCFLSCYPRSLLVYTFGKVLLAPGQRVGFALCSPLMKPRERSLLTSALSSAAFLTYSHANALMQRCLPQLHADCRVDLSELMRRRDVLCSGLSTIGYAVVVPESTFYVLVAHPLMPISVTPLVDRLAERGVYVLDGIFCEIPSHFRISLTATFSMCELAIPIFQQVFHSF